MALLSRHTKIIVGLMGGAALFVGASVMAEDTFSTDADQTPAAVAAPGATVGTKAIHARPVRLWTGFAGRMMAVNTADLRVEVSGRITEIRFRDGDRVKAGDVLFVIDPSTYEVAVARAEAGLRAATSEARVADAEFERARQLVAKKSVSRSVFDQRAGARDMAQAAVAAAEAALKSARLDLDRAYLKAPISGRVSRPEVTIGNLVGPGSGSPVLTSIVSDDGIYADFEIDEQTYVRMRREAGNATDAAIPVELTTGDNPDAPVYRGTIYGFDNRIDTASGTIRARARFANDDGALVPGMFVNVRVETSGETPALLVPERAIANDQDKKIVYVVGLDDSAQPRQVRLGAAVGNERIVTAGLKSGERIVVDGLQHVTPGAKLIIQEAVALNTAHGAP